MRKLDALRIDRAMVFGAGGHHTPNSEHYICKHCLSIIIYKQRLAVDQVLNMGEGKKSLSKIRGKDIFPATYSVMEPLPS